MRVAFALTFYRDERLATSTIADLRMFYPESLILIFDDSKQRLKLAQFAGRWTERYLKAFLQTESDILIKLDPDTAVLRRANEFPDSEIFGEHVDGQVLGGCIGYSRDCARKIIESDLLVDSKYTGLHYTYMKFGERVSRQDEIMADIIRRLHLHTVEWKEACIRQYHPRSVMPTGDYAIVHPDMRPEAFAFYAENSRT
jgi:hypothetical protein